MNENIKIVIQEDNKSTPVGAGVSSDVVFVPGFSASRTAPKNQPTLCTSVSDFKSTFGTKPRVLGYRDCDDTTNKYGCYAGDYDRSYVYASELLHNGLSVIYSNIDGRDFSNVTSAIELDSSLSEDDSISLTTSNAIEIKNNFNTKEFTFTHQVSIPANTSTKIERKTIEYDFSYVDHNNAELTDANVQISWGDCYIETTVTKGSGESATDETVKLKSSETGFTLKKLADTSELGLSIENTTTDPQNLYIVFKVTLKNVPEIKNTLTLKNTEDSLLSSFYDDLSSQLKLIEDRNEYSVKYITTGGYPAIIEEYVDENGDKDTLNCGTSMLASAFNRGDAVAIIDYQSTRTSPLYTKKNEIESVYNNMQSLLSNALHNEYGAAFYPWGVYNCATTLGEIDSSNTHISMPGSFAYLMCLSKSIQTGPNWLAMAGVSRGLVPNLKSLITSELLTNMIAENYQPKFGSTGKTISINPITKINPYGLTLWGNRTLAPVAPNGTMALNFLNVRNMISDIKKVLYSTSTSLMFEQDSDILWLKFKSNVSPLLDQLVSGNGLKDYKIIRNTTKYKGEPLTHGEMSATIKIQPRYAIEYFELTVVITDQDVSVE